MVEFNKMKSKEFYGLIIILIFSIIFLGISIFFNWSSFGPLGTIALSIELGMMGTLFVIFYSNRKIIVLSSSIETKAIGRILELNQSLKNYHQK